MLKHVLPLVLMLGGQTPPPAQAPPAQTPPPPAQVTAPRPPPPIYSETADVKKQLAGVLHNAHLDNVRVFINWGANDCDRCATFSRVTLRAPEITKATPSWFADEYDVVNVNVGHLDKNMDLAKQYGATLDAARLPAFTVLDGDGKVLANVTSADFASTADSAAFDPAKVVSFLTRYQAPPAPDAIAQFEAAQKQAKKDGKSVFVWFSAPW